MGLGSWSVPVKVRLRNHGYNRRTLERHHVGPHVCASYQSLIEEKGQLMNYVEAIMLCIVRCTSMLQSTAGQTHVSPHGGISHHPSV